MPAVNDRTPKITVSETSDLQTGSGQIAHIESALEPVASEVGSTSVIA
jgi:hypothetical protein